MTDRQKIHLLLVMMINLVIVGLLIRQAWEGNDKAIILVIFFYPLLILVNAIVWGLLRAFRRAEFKVYRMTTIVLVILFIPAVFLATMY